VRRPGSDAGELRARRFEGEAEPYEYVLASDPFHGSLRGPVSKAVVGEPDPAVQEGDGGYADRVMIAIRCLQEYLGRPYRRLLDVFRR